MPSPDPAKFIPQASVIPFRHASGGVEFCLITSLSSKRWGFPKGIVETGDTPQHSALQEAFEEAGLHGHIVGDPLGTYRYEKWNAELAVTVYLMEVEQADDSWLESGTRQRAWLPAVEAMNRLDRERLRSMLRAAEERLARTA
jgi:8-oxo-dGTP pyrophosphatase MutT (NUDIX family)